MNTNYLEKDRTLFLEITEDMDHHGVEMIRNVVDDAIMTYMPRKVIFDFDRVAFMDSAAIGMLIGRYKNVKMIGGSVEIINLKQSMKKVLEMSGVLKIIPIKMASDNNKKSEILNFE